MFTNSFGNFLNVHEHFKKFQWNILKCSPTNFLMNIFNSSKKIPIFFWVCSQTFFTRHFDLKCLQTCSGTFWMFRNILKSSNGTFWNFLYVQEHFKKFQQNILKCSPTNFLMNIFKSLTNFLAEQNRWRKYFWKYQGSNFVDCSFWQKCWCNLIVSDSSLFPWQNFSKT